ncbi:MAG: hypothetical protein IRZ32_16325 [Solirubrobacteraceae bacterium]|nr:hypothetical protein [Solirubrobacteraceae bacterium]
MSAPPSPFDPLAAAQRMLDAADPTTASGWPRATALLARQALEDALAKLWAQRAPGVEKVPMRAQLACLPAYLSDPELASEAAYAWHALSRAIHHHPYELDPTREELASLLRSVRRFAAAVDA